MDFNTFKDVIEKDNIIKFKLYSMEYIIKKENNKFIIYPVLYKNKYKSYDSLRQALKEYQVYNESIFDNISNLYILNN